MRSAELNPANVDLVDRRSRERLPLGVCWLIWSMVSAIGWFFLFWAFRTFTGN